MPIVKKQHLKVLKAAGPGNGFTRGIAPVLPVESQGSAGTSRPDVDTCDEYIRELPRNPKPFHSLPRRRQNADGSNESESIAWNVGESIAWERWRNAPSDFTLRSVFTRRV